MQTANVILALLALLLFGWALWLRRTLDRQITPLPSEPDPISPLFQAAAAAFDGGFLLVDEDRRVRFLNDQAREILRADQQIIGQGLIGLLRDYHVEAAVTETLADGEAREEVVRVRNGERTLRLRITAVQIGTMPSAMLLIRDVTQLSVLERARRDMVANVSHELRTPLASVKLLVETLQSDPPAPIARRMLGQMAHEVDAITQLVDELHELSQIESGRVVLQMGSTSLTPVVERALERIHPQAERKGVTVAADLSEHLPAVVIDDGRVGQVLLNLLHNAVKFTASGGQVGVSAVVAQSGGASHSPDLPQDHPAGEWIVVRVTDNGVGIPQEDLPRIFERFYKVDRARTRNAGGTGLGLAIAKHLIEGHGGRIWARSNDGRGSTFFFTLPPEGR